MISDGWLAEDSEPNVNAVKNVFPPATSKYTRARSGALYVAILCRKKYPDPAAFKKLYRSAYMLRKAEEWKSKHQLGTGKYSMGTDKCPMGTGYGHWQVLYGHCVANDGQGQRLWRDRPTRHNVDPSSPR
jgi:hypothetical protein